MNLKVISIFGGMILFLSSCYLAEDVADDQEIWGYEQPSAVGLNEASLLEIDAAVKIDRFEKIEGLLIVKDQNIVFENYYARPQRNDTIPLLRMSALLASTAVGLLLKDRLLDSITTPIYALLPSYSYVFESTPQKREITLLDLLQHTSGLIWDEVNLSYDSPSNFINQMKESDDWVAFVLEQNVDAPAGLRTVYNTGSAMIISRIVENLTGLSAEEYLNRNLFRQMNIDNVTWEAGKGAQTDLSTGLSLDIIGITKIGYLYLNQGFWRGQELLPPSFVRTSTTGSDEVSQIANYAANWHYFSDNLNFTSNWRENDVFYFSNEEGTHLYVVPHLNTVITIRAENLFYGFSNPSLFLFLNLMSTPNS
jgi:CubicO group peptidase (beta-lactamase class C family)